MKQLKCECNIKIYAKGMCWHCYRRDYDAKHKRPEKLCDTCNQIKPYQGKGMCSDCYFLWYHRRQDIKQKRKNRDKRPEKIIEHRLYVKKRMKIDEKFRAFHILSNHIWAKKKWKEDIFFRKKQLARQKAGRDLPLPEKCDICLENKKLQRHHQDYSKPLEVMFLCQKCHYVEDMKLQNKYLMIDEKLYGFDKEKKQLILIR